MRITNNMIVGNTKNNINSNKINVDKYNTQMTTQKKIAKASENPVIAIRSLRLSTSLSHINQYVDNNIPDSIAWLEVTETALTNMKNIVTDIRTQCVNGSNDPLNEDDRKTILQNLTALSDQVYSEGNADYAGRTVFTGYRTSSNLTFLVDDTETTYQVDQKFTFADLEEHRYYDGKVEVPNALTTTTPDCDVDTQQHTYNRLRLGYGDLLGGNSITSSILPDADYNTYATFPGTIGDNEIAFIQDTGELVFGDAIAEKMRTEEATLSFTYEKHGFKKGEVRPEYYYDCRDITDTANVITYEKEDQNINITIANNTELNVNTQASDVFTTDIARDMTEMINAVQFAIDAHEKVSKIERMMHQEQYGTPEMQEKLQTYLDAAKKEADYADDNMQKLYGQYITNFDNYLLSINTAITNIGSLTDRLQLTKNRVENQQSTIEELKTNNEDREISDIIIDYSASYNAYQASLTAASKVEKQTLLDYI